MMEIIKEALKENKIIYGSKKVLKALLRGEVKSVYVAKNCPLNIKEDLKRYCELCNIEFKELDLDNKELGTLIGRAHGVSTIAIKW